MGVSPAGISSGASCSLMICFRWTCSGCELLHWFRCLLKTFNKSFKWKTYVTTRQIAGSLIRPFQFRPFSWLHLAHLKNASHIWHQSSRSDDHVWLWPVGQCHLDPNRATSFVCPLRMGEPNSSTQLRNDSVAYKLNTKTHKIMLPI